MNKDSNNKNFFEKVYEFVRSVPYGRVTTYGTIAKHIGSPQSSRMVGWALNVSHTITPVVPAHRVVNRNGILSGKQHFVGEFVMEDLLISEGLILENNQVVDFDKKFWEPPVDNMLQ